VLSHSNLRLEIATESRIIRQARQFVQRECQHLRQKQQLLKQRHYSGKFPQVLLATVLCLKLIASFQNRLTLIYIAVAEGLYLVSGTTVQCESPFNGTFEILIYFTWCSAVPICRMWIGGTWWPRPVHCIQCRTVFSSCRMSWRAELSNSLMIVSKPERMYRCFHYLFVE